MGLGLGVGFRGGRCGRGGRGGRCGLGARCGHGDRGGRGQLPPAPCGGRGLFWLVVLAVVALSLFV